MFTNGCYDLLHPGHIRLLESARSLGDVLILALNTDASVQRLKGPSRPLISEQDRIAVAAALEAVDAVTTFDEDTPRELIAEVLPDVLIKGADWAHFIAGREEVEAAGGRVLALPLEPGYSTTNMVDVILETPVTHPAIRELFESLGRNPCIPGTGAAHRTRRDEAVALGPDHDREGRSTWRCWRMPSNGRWW